MKILGKRRARPFVGAVAKSFQSRQGSTAFPKFRRRFHWPSFPFDPLSDSTRPIYISKRKKRQEEAGRKNRRRVAKNLRAEAQNRYFPQTQRKTPAPSLFVRSKDAGANLTRPLKSVRRRLERRVRFAAVRGPHRAPDAERALAGQRFPGRNIGQTVRGDGVRNEPNRTRTTSAPKLERRLRFAAVRGSHRAPNAERALTGQRFPGRNIGQAVRVDRFRNEANRTVEETAVDAARVIAGRGVHRDLRLLLVVFPARRRVRRHNGRETGQHRETVEPVAATRVLDDRARVSSRVVTALVHAETRLRDPVPGVETGVVNDRAADFVVRVVPRARFGTSDRVARAVGDPGEVPAFIPVENGAVVAVPPTGALADQAVTAVPVPFDFPGRVVHVVNTSDAVGHAVNDVRRTTVVIVLAAKFDEFARLLVGRAEERRNFRRADFPRFAAVRARKPRLRQAGIAVDRVFQRRLLHIRQKLVVNAKTPRFDAGTVRELRRQVVVNVLMVLQREQILLHVVRA